MHFPSDPHQSDTNNKKAWILSHQGPRFLFQTPQIATQSSFQMEQEQGEPS
jgi:hypothetical protein